MSIEDMVREWAKEHAPKAKPPTFLVEALRDQAQFYTRENPFKVGDLVTPRKGTCYVGAGEVHLVIAVNEYAEYDFGNVDPVSNRYGRKLDIRVLSWVQGQWPAHWVESAGFEPWVEPAAKAEDAPAADPASLDARVTSVEAA